MWAFRGAMEDASRRYIWREELLAFEWHFRMKESAGQHFTDADPWWQRAPVGKGRTLRDIARPALDIARSGLAARARLNTAGDNETGYLSDLEEVVSSGKTHAERLLDRYHGEWGGDVSKIYAEESF